MINLHRAPDLSVLILPQPVPLGLATHGCGAFPLRLPRVREYGGERILIPEGKPKRAPRSRKLARRRRAARANARVR